MSEHQTNNQDPGPELSAGWQSARRGARVVFYALVVTMAGTMVFYLCRSFVVVDKHERAVILRFGAVAAKAGQPVREPGFHLAFPYPIDECVKVPAQRTQKVGTDRFWYASEDGDQGGLRPGKGGYCLTGDQSLMHRRWSVEYTITDTVSYAGVSHSGDSAVIARKVKRVLRALLAQAVTETACGLDVDEVWRNPGGDLQRRVREALDRRADELGLGVAITKVYTEDVQPPRAVRREFKLVTSAVTDSSGLVSQARSRRQELQSAAEMTRERLLSGARADHARTVSEAESDVGTYRKLYPEYRRDPALFRRLYLRERLSGIVSQVDRRFLVDPGRQRQLRILLNDKSKEQADDGERDQ